jgi:RimJ/RimL family protein N-acetyltransferase
MFDININLDDLNISSVEKEDILNIQMWINDQNCTKPDCDKPLPLKEFYERFLEYYVSESEFFLKINQGEKLVGVLKGRIEFKNTSEVWLWYFLIDSNCREKGLGTKILEKITSYFSNELGIYNFYTGVCEKDTGMLSFWNKNSFRLIRVSKDYFNVDGEELDMIVMGLET